MALVMLPCDLPWWPNVVKKLQALQGCTNVEDVIDSMQKIHDLCNVSLDPDEDKCDPTIFNGFRDFLVLELNSTELKHFITDTLKNVIKRAVSLKANRPSRGLEFSLQQQPDAVEISYDLCAALVANAFFSTFPKRTDKTHPTLQDFNFTHFFKNLDLNSQKIKLRSILYYFDWMEINGNKEGRMKVYRKVMNGRQWLTIEDWLESTLPLCSLDIKHERKIESSEADVVQTIFASSRLGGKVLYNGNSQECFHFSIFPDILPILLFIEALEDNETIHIENARQFSRINKFMLEKLEVPRKVSVILMDAENYSQYPLNQFEEDDILRELNKCLLAFRQNAVHFNINKCDRLPKPNPLQRRLSPIGESCANTPKEASTTIVIRQATSSTKRSSYDSEKIGNDIVGRRSWLCTSPGTKIDSTAVVGSEASNRRGRFIILGSSGECLPVTRNSLLPSDSNSLYSSCDSGSESYFSAKASLDNGNDDVGSDDELLYAQKYSKELDTSDKRYTFAEKLRAALRQSQGYSESLDSNYAVDISISGSKNGDEGIRIKRGRSTGFVLNDDSFDNDYQMTALMEHTHSDKKPLQNGVDNDGETSSIYSFSTDDNVGDLETFNEQLSKCLGENWDKIDNDINPRNEALLNFANSLLKRTLSESFVGVPLTDGCMMTVGDSGIDGSSSSNGENKTGKLKLTSRSLSLELAKYKHRLATQLLSQLKSKRHGTVSGVQPVATGNWGCGQTLSGDMQLKMIIQWMAASFAGLPYLIYYTAGHEKLSKMDTLCRVLLDRKWSVGELASAIVCHAKDILTRSLDTQYDDQCLFEKLIGIL